MQTDHPHGLKCALPSLLACRHLPLSNTQSTQHVLLGTAAAAAGLLDHLGYGLPMKLRAQGRVLQGKALGHVLAPKEHPCCHDDMYQWRAAGVWRGRV